MGDGIHGGCSENHLRRMATAVDRSRCSFVGDRIIRSSAEQQCLPDSGHGGISLLAGVLRSAVEAVQHAVGGDRVVDGDSDRSLVHELWRHCFVGEFPVQFGDAAGVRVVSAAEVAVSGDETAV